MNQIILKPINKNGIYEVVLPRGLKFSICFVVKSNKIPQNVNYADRLEIGHDFQISNGIFYSRRKEVLENGYLLIVLETKEENKCKICKKNNSKGSNFCSNCGNYLF